MTLIRPKRYCIIKTFNRFTLDTPKNYDNALRETTTKRGPVGNYRSIAANVSSAA